MRYISVLISMAVVSCGIGGARADQSAQPLDDNFLVKAASCDNAEIQISKLADKHAASADVKQFAAQLIEDHKKNYDKLAALLKNTNLAIASGFEKETKDEISRLEKLQGAEFDREFLSFMVAGHKKAIECFEAQAKDGKNAGIRSFASESLPTLKEHLKRAEELSKQGK